MNRSHRIAAAFVLSSLALGFAATASLQKASALSAGDFGTVHALDADWSNKTPDFNDYLNGLSADADGALGVANSGYFVNFITSSDFDVTGKTDYTVTTEWHGTSDDLTNEHHMGVMPFFVDGGSNVNVFVKYMSAMKGQGYYEVWVRAVSWGVISEHWSGFDASGAPTFAQQEWCGARINAEMGTAAEGGFIKVIRSREYLWTETPIALDCYNIFVNNTTTTADLTLFYKNHEGLDAFDSQVGVYAAGDVIWYDSFDVSDRKIDATFPSVTLEQTNYDYTGEAIEPNATVTVSGRTLRKGVDYDVAYTNNVNPGKGTATITLKGKYKRHVQWTENHGEGIPVEFTIDPIDASGATVTLPETVYTYTGEAIQPNPVVTLAGKTLVKDTDYTLDYEDNVEVGTAKIKISFLGGYAGSTETTFTIAAIDASKATVTLDKESYEFEGSPVTPQVTVKLAGAEIASSEYDVSYANNTAVGTGIVTVTFKNHYSGTVEKAFAIVEKATSSEQSSEPASSEASSSESKPSSSASSESGETKKGGCGGSVIAASAFVAGLALAGAAIALKSKKK